MTFYNTNQEKGAELHRSRRKTNRQETFILAYFQNHPGFLISPSQLLGVVGEWPLTSIRRALTNLTKDGYLVKTSHLHIGIYGKKEHCWSLNPASFRESLFDE